MSSELLSDVTFGGANLDRLIVTGIRAKSPHGDPHSDLASSLLEYKGTGLSGVREHRFKF